MEITAMTDRDATLPARRSRLRRAIRLAAAIGVAITLSGCIIAPYPGYYHPHYYHPYYGY
jgi:hypothetical protein